jgi:hypothetical protein
MLRTTTSEQVTYVPGTGPARPGSSSHILKITLPFSIEFKLTWTALIFKHSGPRSVIFTMTVVHSSVLWRSTPSATSKGVNSFFGALKKKKKNTADAVQPPPTNLRCCWIPILSLLAHFPSSSDRANLRTILGPFLA